jgi:hypothetical protein
MAKSKARQALEFFRRTAANAASGTDLHNAFFGNGGEFGRLFPSRDEREAFMRTAEYREIVRIQDRADQVTKRVSA